MKILFDISILGRGHVNAGERTGIFRAIESVADELVVQPDCNVTFCANLNWKDVALAKDYFNSNSKLSNASFSEPLNYVKPIQLRKQYISPGKNHSSDRSLLHFLKKTTTKIINKPIHIRDKIINRFFNKELLHPNDLKCADIYHSHFYTSFNGIKEAGVKSLFMTSYDVIPILYPQFCSDGMHELMVSQLNKLTPDTWVVCISEATRSDLLNYMGNKLDPNKVKVTELAASDLFYQSTDKRANHLVRSKYGVPDTPYILSLCTLEPRKNIDQAIRAFIKLVKQENIPDLNLILVGAKGWKFQKIFDSLEASDVIKKRIYITGYMADEDLAAMYSDAMMFVYPSFYEGFGLPPLEAMQCGVPVVTSNTSSLPEVVGDAAIMIDPTDLDSLCDAMLSIYKHSGLRDQMVQKSLERAKRFSWKRCAEETVNAYKLSMS